MSIYYDRSYLQQYYVSIIMQQYYGYYVEEEWVQMYPVSGGVIYLNKLTGRLQSGRPEEYRPFLKVSFSLLLSLPSLNFFF